MSPFPVYPLKNYQINNAPLFSEAKPSTPPLFLSPFVLGEEATEASHGVPTRYQVRHPPQPVRMDGESSKDRSWTRTIPVWSWPPPPLFEGGWGECPPEMGWVPGGLTT